MRRNFIIHSILASVAFVTFTDTASAHPDSDHLDSSVDRLDPTVRAECKRLEKVEYPEPDKPTAEQEKELKNCDAENFYYGIKTEIDFIKARHCAFSTQNRVRAPNYGVLMMLYANGQGVTQNYTIAKKATCNAEGAPAEIVGRMQHLRNMEAGKEGAHPEIDFCNDITSGYMQGYCAWIWSELADQAREQKFVKLTSSWNVTSQTAFRKLKKHAESFITERSFSEVDQSGTARGALVALEDVTQKEDFLKTLQDFEAGDLPRFSQDDYVKLNRELNQVYQQLKRKKDLDFGTVEMDGVQRVQRSWLAYRDAWVKFGKAKYPSVPEYAWKAYFTKKRTEMLKGLIRIY